MMFHQSHLKCFAYDFMELKELKELVVPWKGESKGENLKLLYVAASRAKTTITLNENLTEFLEFLAKERLDIRHRREFSALFWDGHFIRGLQQIHLRTFLFIIFFFCLCFVSFLFSKRKIRKILRWIIVFWKLWTFGLSNFPINLEQYSRHLYLLYSKVWANSERAKWWTNHISRLCTIKLIV